MLPRRLLRPALLSTPLLLLAAAHVAARDGAAGDGVPRRTEPAAAVAANGANGTAMHGRATPATAAPSRPAPAAPTVPTPASPTPAPLTAAPLTAAGAAAMVRLPAGHWRPLYAAAGDAPVAVAAFRLDRDPVTRGDYLAFVRAHPAWRRGAVPADAADPTGYLADWPDALDAGDGTDLRRPVAGVSRPAARAYCAAQGKRLPTVAEWEYAAAADGREPEALVAVYAARRWPAPPVDAARVGALGVRGLHDLAWEWVDDRIPVAADHGDHGDHFAQADGATVSCASAAIGAADPTDYAAFLRHALRAGATERTTLGSLGFRCAA